MIVEDCRCDTSLLGDSRGLGCGSGLVVDSRGL